MNNKQQPRRNAPSSSAGGKPRGAPRSAAKIGAREEAPGVWSLLHPRCALERMEDLEEVRQMIAADEMDVALDELRWLLGGCPDFLDAHRLLGEIALSSGDVPLARAHFGVAVQLGLAAMKGRPGTLPYRFGANESFHESAKGLVYALKKLDKQELAEEVAGHAIRLDPADPLAIRALLGGVS